VANAFTFDGTDFSTLGVTYLTAVPGVLPSPKFARDSVGFRDLSVGGASTFPERTISIALHVHGTSASDLRDKLDSIALALSSREDAALSLDNWPSRYWMARVGSEVRPQPMGPLAAACEIEFVCADPFGYASVESTDDDTIEAAASHEFSLVVGGTAPALPVFVVVPTAASAPVVISNETTGEKISWENALAATDQIRINCSTQYIDVADQATETYDASMLNVAGRFPTLAPGVTNNLIISGVPSGAVGTTWRNRYM